MLVGMHEDNERCVRAVQSKDARFDGWFFTAVIDHRDLLPAELPGGAAEAGEHALLPERRRRPAGRVPGLQAVPAGRQPRLAAVERAGRPGRPGHAADRRRGDRPGGVPGLAARLGYSVRQVERQLLAELGAGPLALARAQRAQTARLLIETTALPMGDVAFAAGFASIRTFNDTVREVFALSADRAAPPGAPRRGRRRRPAAAARCRCGCRSGCRCCPDNLFGHLAATAVPGVEEWRDGAYRRTLRLPHGHGDRRAAARARAHRLPADPGRPARPGHRDQPLPPAARPGRRPGRGRRRCSAPTRCSRRWWPRRRAAGCRAPWTRPSSRSARCSASRCPPPRPAPTPAGWPPRTASR